MNNLDKTIVIQLKYLYIFLLNPSKFNQVRIGRIGMGLVKNGKHKLSHGGQRHHGKK